VIMDPNFTGDDVKAIVRTMGERMQEIQERIRQLEEEEGT